MALTRRQMLMASGAALIGPALASRSLASSLRGLAGKKVLFFTKSSGFQHSVIERKDGKPSLAETILAKIGKDNGIEVVCSKDGTMFDPEKIKQFDAFVFVTTGDLTEEGPHHDGPPMSKDGKKALLEAIHDGKGFMGMHCATDTFHSKAGEIDPYIKMIGGEFITHGSQQKVKINIDDAKFPGADGFGSGSFEITDEWYAQKNQPEDLHVILSHDTASFPDKKGGNACYDRPNFPQTWARAHGKGRVFYTSMGHREDVWENPKYQGLLVGAMSWVLGQADADVKPNAAKVTPDFQKLKNS